MIDGIIDRLQCFFAAQTVGFMSLISPDMVRDHIVSAIIKDKEFMELLNEQANQKRMS